MDSFITAISIICILVFIFAAYFPCIRSLTYEGLDAPSSTSTNQNALPETTTISVPTLTQSTTTIVDPTKVTDFSNTKYNNDISKIKEIQYHKTEEEIRQESGQPMDSTWIYDKDGNKVLYPNAKVQGSITYHTPGSYPFGTANYVPKYEDSVYLSKITGLNNQLIIKPTADMLGGFCTQYKDQPDKIEESCKNIDINKCASTNCCVLLGGSTCVAGNEFGPTQKTNYNDIFIRNKEYYYYQGKCYGNCP
jgi:hypothetical protein